MSVLALGSRVTGGILPTGGLFHATRLRGCYKGPCAFMFRLRIVNKISTGPLRGYWMEN